MPRFFDLSALLPESPLRPILSPLCRLLEFPLGLHKLNAIGKQIDHSNTPTFLRQSLEVLGIELELPPKEAREKISQLNTPLIVAANHPTGATDSIALLNFLERTFPSRWKVLSNHFIGQFPALEKQRILINPGKGGANMNQAALRQALRHLNQGGVLSLFPAGRVSARARDLGYPQLGDLPFDLPWQEHLLRLAQKTKASILLVHLDAQNSPHFLDIPQEKRLKRTLALAKEVAKPQSPKLPLRIARLILVDELEKVTAKDLQYSCYLENWQNNQAQESNAESNIKSNAESEQSSKPSESSPTIPQASKEAQVEATQLAQSQELLLSQSNYQLFCVQGKKIPALLQELGRARAETFAAAGQGTGQEIDLHAQDQHYHHLILWQQQSKQLAGAYRLGFVEEILATQGMEGLYLNGVFEINPKYYEQLQSAVELSRSFVRSSFQRDNLALQLLWRGLGLLSNQKDIHNLFGSVTISAQHSQLSQGAIVQYLKEHRMDEDQLRKWVTAPQPFQAPQDKQGAYLGLLQGHFTGKRIDELEPWIKRFEQGNLSIPPLMRYYDLLGARYSSFQVEASFGNALYNLLRVDLKHMPPRYRKRYLGA